MSRPVHEAIDLAEPPGVGARTGANVVRLPFLVRSKFPESERSCWHKEICNDESPDFARGIPVVWIFQRETVADLEVGPLGHMDIHIHRQFAYNHGQ